MLREREKMIRPIRSHRCVSFGPKFPPFIGVCSLQRPLLTSCFADIQRADSFSRRLFLVKKGKHFGNWSGIVSCFTVDEENCRDPAKKQRKNRTKRKLKVARLDFLGGIPPKFEH